MKLPSREIITSLRDWRIKILEYVGIDLVVNGFHRMHVVIVNEMYSSECFVLVTVSNKRSWVIKSRTISASWYSSKTSSVFRRVPLRIVGSSREHWHWKVMRYRLELTRYYSQATTKVRYAYASNIESVDYDTPFRRVHKAEERQRFDIHWMIINHRVTISFLPRVLFPEPVLPRIPIFSLGWTSKEILWSTLGSPGWELRWATLFSEMKVPYCIFDCQILADNMTYDAELSRHHQYILAIEFTLLWPSRRWPGLQYLRRLRGYLRKLFYAFNGNLDEPFR